FPSEGGGIFNGSETGMEITNSTITDNRAGDGGGIYNAGPMTISDSTISGNATYGLGFGGGIANYATVTLTVSNSTMSGTSPGYGGRIYGNLNMRNTTLAANSASILNIGPALYGNLSASGHNLIGDGTRGSGFAASDLVGTSSSRIDPELGPLE